MAGGHRRGHVAIVDATASAGVATLSENIDSEERSMTCCKGIEGVWEFTDVFFRVVSGWPRMVRLDERTTHVA
jgi:hypothetical protein